MPTCPNCKTEQSRRRSGACPKCGAQVTLYTTHGGSTIWILEGAKSPLTELVELFEFYRSRQLKHPFGFNRRTGRYKQELRYAANLLEQVDYDIALAKRAFAVLFTDPRWNWKTYDSILYVYGSWPAVVSVATDLLIQEATKEKLEQKAYEAALAQGTFNYSPDDLLGG
jgi:hypothetical protein